jgi:hypothetical protein
MEGKYPSHWRRDREPSECRKEKTRSRGLRLRQWRELKQSFSENREKVLQPKTLEAKTLEAKTLEEGATRFVKKLLIADHRQLS